MRNLTPSSDPGFQLKRDFVNPQQLEIENRSDTLSVLPTVVTFPTTPPTLADAIFPLPSPDCRKRLQYSFHADRGRGIGQMMNGVVLAYYLAIRSNRSLSLDITIAGHTLERLQGPFRWTCPKVQSTGRVVSVWNNGYTDSPEKVIPVLLSNDATVTLSSNTIKEGLRQLGFHGHALWGRPESLSLQDTITLYRRYVWNTLTGEVPTVSHVVHLRVGDSLSFKKGGNDRRRILKLCGTVKKSIQKALECMENTPIQKPCVIQVISDNADAKKFAQQWTGGCSIEVSKASSRPSWMKLPLKEAMETWKDVIRLRGALNVVYTQSGFSEASVETHHVGRKAFRLEEEIESGRMCKGKEAGIVRNRWLETPNHRTPTTPPPTTVSPLARHQRELQEIPAIPLNGRVQSLFLSQDTCQNLRLVRIIGNGIVKRVWEARMGNETVAVKEVLPNNIDSKKGQPYLPTLKLMKEATMFMQLEQQYGRHAAVHCYGICLTSQYKVVIVLEKLPVLHKTRTKVAWMPMLKRMANFHGGALEIADFKWEQFVVKKNEIHCIDLGDVVFTNNPTRVIEQGIESVHRIGGVLPNQRGIQSGGLPRHKLVGTSNSERGSLTTTYPYARVMADQSMFVWTGDIGDMWIRDSAAQVWPYLHTDKALVEGTLKRQAMYIDVDPYANSYREKKQHFPDDKRLGRGGYVATRNFELDSGCYFLRLLYAYHQVNPDYNIEPYRGTVQRLVSLWKTEQHHEERSPYRYVELPRQGLGSKTVYTGMVWTGFRPSDDPCTYGYHIPDNLFLVTVMDYVQSMFPEIDLGTLQEDVRRGIERYGTWTSEEGIERYCYEVDGLGGCNQMDDANVPSLLSIPYVTKTVNERIYSATYDWVWSLKNPYFYRGTAAEGIGSPHTPKDHIWPMSILVRGLVDPSQRSKSLETVQRTTAGTGRMHESFHKNYPSRFTRKDFAWADALYKELKTLTLRFALGIPAIWADRAALLNDLLPSVLSQTKRPSEVVVAISGVPHGEGEVFREDARRACAPIPLTMVVQEQLRTAGWARNTIANKVANAQWIAFVDSDDELHPERIERVSQFLQANPELQLLLHSHSTSPQRIQTKDVVSGERLLKSARLTASDMPLLPGEKTPNIHHGHPVVHVDLFRTFQYKEKMRRAQDTEFLHSVMLGLNDPSKYAMLDVPLTIHTPRSARKQPTSPNICDPIINPPHDRVVKISQMAYVWWASEINYIWSALVAMKALRSLGTRVDFVLLTTIEPLAEQLLSVKNVTHILKTPLKHMNHPTYLHAANKFYVFSLTQYRRIIFMDADSMPLKNLDHLFGLPMASVITPCSYWEKNPKLTSWLMILQPNNTLFQQLVSFYHHPPQPRTKLGKPWADMDVIAEVTALHPHLPSIYGLLNSEWERGDKVYRLHGDPEDVWNNAPIVHFTAKGKPWQHARNAFQGSNWDEPFRRLHQRWWELRDSLSI